MEINGQTKLADILAEYPFMKTGMVEINGKFKMLQTPMGKMMVGPVELRAADHARAVADEAVVERREGVRAAVGRMRQASRELIKVYAQGATRVHSTT